MEKERLSYLQIHPKDNVLVALRDLPQGFEVTVNGQTFLLREGVRAKHKFSIYPLDKDADVMMYGVLVGKMNYAVTEGILISTENLRHASDNFKLGARKLGWEKPDVSGFRDRMFNGFHRSNGSVGTANYWLVIPLVFCENRNVLTLKEALEEKLGYQVASKDYSDEVDELIARYQSGASVDELLSVDLSVAKANKQRHRLFPNIDGVKFLNHDMGCGGTRMDSDALCGLLAGYITHPNVAGATVLSLGCQHAQASILRDEIAKRDPQFDKPLYVFEQQLVGTETELLQQALKHTCAGLLQAHGLRRHSALICTLCIGLACGGSDDFSGISATPALGYVSDMLVALGGSVILSEFPELCGVEPELTDRRVHEEMALRFMALTVHY